jgi:hypothetical protein
MKNPHAVALGRKGGKSKSAAKKSAGIQNAKKAREARLLKAHEKTR